MSGPEQSSVGWVVGIQGNSGADMHVYIIAVPMYASGLSCHEYVEVALCSMALSFPFLLLSNILRGSFN
jgi:hypothetical protein